MYRRIKKWITAITPTSKSESGWENTFTTEEDDVVDIRFTLNGYGWKPSASDENLLSLEKGSYKIYYRENGQSTWNFLARVESNRDNQDSTSVYRNTAFATGLLPSGKYDIKIVADKGSKFTAWGGSIEGIASGGQFWGNLEVRALAYKTPNVNDEVTITENVNMGLV